MKKIVLSFLLIKLAIVVTAQVPIVEEVFPVKGNDEKTAHYIVAVNYSMDSSQYWDALFLELNKLLKKEKASQIMVMDYKLMGLSLIMFKYNYFNEELSSRKKYELYFKTWCEPYYKKHRNEPEKDKIFVMYIDKKENEKSFSYSKYPMVKYRVNRSKNEKIF